MHSNRNESALRGVKVLDVAALFPAPLLAAMLGDYGADVVKVEPPQGDGLRHVGTPSPQGSSSAWAVAGRNKRSVVLDLGDDVDINTLIQLTSVADIIVTNQSHQQLARWHCTTEEIAERNPRAIIVSLTAFGSSGPLRNVGANGTIAEAFSGVAELIGDRDGPPTLPSFALGDTLGAISAFNGVLAALYWRDANDGRGQFIDASLYEPLLGLITSTFASWKDTDAPPTRNGCRLANAAPRNLYQTSDEHWMALSATTDAQVARVFDLMSASNALRARYAKSHQRVGTDADALDAEVAAWICELTLADVLTRCHDARIPAAPVQSLNDVSNHHHVISRNNLVPLSSEHDAIRVPAPTPTLSETPAHFRRAAPNIGAHTHEVLHDWLNTDNAADGHGAKR